jgi:hypothetical protein
MAKTNSAKRRREVPKLTGITVAGYKSIRTERTIEVRPLTLLAGANSTGKSSIMQPLLLFKQTLEAKYDPGPLLLDGPNVAFTDAMQILSRTSKGGTARGFHVAMHFGDCSCITAYFAKSGPSFCLDRCAIQQGDDRFTFRRGMSSAEIRAGIRDSAAETYERPFHERSEESPWELRNEGPFFVATLSSAKPSYRITISPPSATAATRLLQHLIHLPALRGNPKRNYPRTAVDAVGAMFPGTFEAYTATVVARWQDQSNEAILRRVNDDLQHLGLVSAVTAEQLNAAEVELRVSRLPVGTKSPSSDTVSIADVGFGVSQTLPVVVALHVATPENLVYLEQPEIHLHPRAQVAMAEVLARAVRRGCRLVVETHSPLLLLGLQTLVAKGELPSKDVILHWFTRSPRDGDTDIKSAELDEAGAFGDWPEDFGDVTLRAEAEYLNAAEARMGSK